MVTRITGVPLPPPPSRQRRLPNEPIRQRKIPASEQPWAEGKQDFLCVLFVDFLVCFVAIWEKNKKEKELASNRGLCLAGREQMENTLRYQLILVSR